LREIEEQLRDPVTAFGMLGGVAGRAVSAAELAARAGVSEEAARAFLNKQSLEESTLTPIQKFLKSGKVKAALSAAGVATTVAGTTQFLNFIFEEAMQTSAFAFKTAMDAHDYEAAQKALDNWKKVIEGADAQLQNPVVGGIDSLLGGAFRANHDAQKTQWEVAQDALQKALKKQKHTEPSRKELKKIIADYKKLALRGEFDIAQQVALQIKDTAQRASALREIDETRIKVARKEALQAARTGNFEKAKQLTEKISDVEKKLELENLVNQLEARTARKNIIEKTKVLDFKSARAELDKIRDPHERAYFENIINTRESRKSLDLLRASERAQVQKEQFAMMEKLLGAKSEDLTRAIALNQPNSVERMRAVLKNPRVGKTLLLNDVKSALVSAYKSADADLVRVRSRWLAEAQQLPPDWAVMRAWAETKGEYGDFVAIAAAALGQKDVLEQFKLI